MPFSLPLFFPESTSLPIFSIPAPLFTLISTAELGMGAVVSSSKVVCTASSSSWLGLLLLSYCSRMGSLSHPWTSLMWILPRTISALAPEVSAPTPSAQTLVFLTIFFLASLSTLSRGTAAVSIGLSLGQWWVCLGAHWHWLCQTRGSFSQKSTL